MAHLIFSINTTLPIFLTMLVGYLLKKKNIITPSFIDSANNLNYKITLPALLFLDLYQIDMVRVWDTKYVLFCFIVTLISIAVISLFGILFFRKKEYLGEFIQASYRGSAAVLGIAFIHSIYTDSAMGPLMVIASVPMYNVFAILILSLTSPNNQKSNHNPFLLALKEIVTSPIIFAIVLGVVFSLLKPTLPIIATQTLQFFARIATPLALISLGGGFEGKKAIHKLKPTILATFLKLIAFPLLFLPIAYLMGFRDEKMVAILIMLGAPTTASCYIMSRNFQHDGVLSSSAIVATTFFSSITLTFWLFILRFYGII